MKDTTKTRLRETGRKARDLAGQVVEGLARASREESTVYVVETTTPLQRLLNDLTDQYTAPPPRPDPVLAMLTGVGTAKRPAYLTCQVLAVNAPARTVRVRYLPPDYNFEWSSIWSNAAKTAYHTLGTTGPARIVMSSDTRTKVYKTSSGSYFREV